MDVRSYLRHLDFTLLFASVALIVYGVAMVYFATRDDIEGDPLAYARAQVVNAAVGLVLLVVISVIDYEVYRRWQWALYGFAVLSIAAVYVVGTVTRGSRRWIELPFFNLQPSQLGLFLVTVALAAFLVDRVELLGTRKITVAALVYAAIPAALVFYQPDFGTSTVYVALVLALLFFFGTPWTHFAALAGLGLAAFAAVVWMLPIVGLELIKSYQMDRLLVFLDPGRDPGGTGYNVVQSMIAVGSGALTGRGEQATQTTLDFLPEHHTDFIFSVIGERFGFVGAVVLLALYALLLWRALRIATLSRDMYGSIMAGGVAAMLLFQMFVNIGMTIGIMPVTGIPLPFVSYGGAAMITFLLLVGLLESIHVRAMIATTPGVSGGRP
jgi:rod shape determining protein RodA